MNMNKIKWDVAGMNCTGCSATIKNLLESKGMQDVSVDFSSGELAFSNPTSESDSQIITAIENLGFRVILPDTNKKKGLILG
jgi:copper chaperone CopZ